MNERGEQANSLTLSGPAAVVSYPMMVMAEQQPLENLGIKFNFTQWKNPEQLRAMVIGKQVDFSAMPSNLAAAFYNRGHQLTLLNISIWNIMSIVSQQHKKITQLSELIGHEIVVPFKNDMPSIVLSQLLKAQLGEDAKKVSIRYSHNLSNAAQLLFAKQADHALLIEPLTSVALFRSQQPKATKLAVSLNISKQWLQTFPDSSKLPQAGIIANTTINNNAAVLAKVNQAYKNAAVWCQNNRIDCASIVKKYLPQMPKPALVSAIKATQINTVNAFEAKADLEKFYLLLAASDANKIGGQLPAAGFYWQ
ncbi:MAG: ABC transporter substrate-binding protein [Colwellia sp.]|nr:ABC transporter substrate-binding protein [Colwellia sp.]